MSSLPLPGIYPEASQSSESNKSTAMKLLSPGNKHHQFSFSSSSTNSSSSISSSSKSLFLSHNLNLDSENHCNTDVIRNNLDPNDETCSDSEIDSDNLNDI